MALFLKVLLFKIFLTFWKWRKSDIAWLEIASLIECVCVDACVCVRHKWLVIRYMSWWIVLLTILNADNIPPIKCTIRICIVHYFCQRQRCIYHKGMWWAIGSATDVEKSLQTANLLTPLHCYNIFSCVACIIRQTSLYLCGHVTACDVSCANRCCLYSGIVLLNNDTS